MENKSQKPVETLCGFNLGHGTGWLGDPTLLRSLPLEERSPLSTKGQGCGLGAADNLHSHRLP